jgi:predicted Fe-S protein YdhL (DUF1289 family)
MWGEVAKPVLTPCIGICTLGEDGLCDGCHRNAEEIGAWSSLGDAERTRIMLEVLPHREVARNG